MHLSDQDTMYLFSIKLDDRIVFPKKKNKKKNIALPLEVKWSFPIESIMIIKTKTAIIFLESVSLSDYQMQLYM